MTTSIGRDAGRVLLAGFPAGPPPQPLLDAVRRGALGGIVLFGRNVGAPAEVARLVDGVVREAPRDAPILVAVDQEGGRVARLGPPVLPLPPMAELGRIDDPDLTRRAAAVVARQLRALGFDWDFAPVLDVDTNPDNPVIGDRSFGDDPTLVTRHGLAFAAGLGEGGVLGCGKHFPGHGDTELDSHLALPRLPHDRARLDRVELAPFRAARGRIPALMTAHVVFDALDPDVPATLSPAVVTGLLRRELGYDGVVVSDDLEMRAVSERWGVPDAACRAVDAGCDLLLVCSDVGSLFDAHRELVARGESDSDFAAKLHRGAERGIALARRCPPAPVTDPARLDALLGDPEARAVRDAIAERTATR